MVASGHPEKCGDDVKNQMKRSQRKTQRGFSLLELLMVVLLLSIIVGAVFSQIERAQIRYRVEDQKVDMTQQEREFVDQFTRDLHQAGYPSIMMWGGRADRQYDSNYTAVGLWSISQNGVSMEGDVDGDGIVEEVSYQYYDGVNPPWAGKGPNPCPCIRRSSAPKQNGQLPWNQPAPQYFTQVQNIIPVAGQPFFLAYGSNGNVIDTSAPIVLSSTAQNDATFEEMRSIKGVRITFTLQGIGKDQDTHKTIQVTMTGMAHLPNN